jgi:hypothetical protein
MRIKTTLSLAIAGLSIAALTGCAGGAQSVADACSTAQTVVADVQTEMAEVSVDASGGDFSKVTDAFSSLKGKLDEAAGKVSNDEVKSALSGLSAKVSDFAKLFDGVSDGDLTALADKADEFQAAATGVQDAGTKLATLCNS